VVNDIISGISKLDEQDKLPHFAVEVVALNRLSNCIPAETNAINMCDRMCKLELRMKAAEEAMSENSGRTIPIEEEVKNYRSYVPVAKHDLNDSTFETGYGTSGTRKDGTGKKRHSENGKVRNWK